MQTLSARFVVVVSLLVLCGSAMQYLTRVEPPRPLDLGSVPLTVNGWIGREISLEPGVREILETDSVIVREYANPKGTVVGMAVVYYGDSEHVALHLPESCLMGKGSRLAQRRSERIRAGETDFPAVKLVTVRDHGKDIVIYYFQTAGYHTGSYLDFRARMLANQIKGRKTGGALVRFSIAVSPDSKDEEIKHLHDFIYSISGELDRLLS